MTPSYRVILLPRAFDDLDAIVDYIEKDSPQNAASVLDQLWQAAQSLSTLPHRYKIHRSNRKPERVIHSMPVQSFIIYYQIIEHPPTVRVLTIRHGARRQPKRF